MLKGSGKPRPFSAPRIEISTEIVGAKKEWRDCDPREIEVGDIIQGKGLVVGLGEMRRFEDPVRFIFPFEMKNGTTYRYHSEYVRPTHPGIEIGPSIRAFVKVAGG